MKESFQCKISDKNQFGFSLLDSVISFYIIYNAVAFNIWYTKFGGLWHYFT